MKYDTGGAFRRALEDRLRAQSLQSGTPLVRPRKMIGCGGITKPRIEGFRQSWDKGLEWFELAGRAQPVQEGDLGAGGQERVRA